MNQFRDKNTTELDALLNEKREALRVFRFAVFGGKEKNVKTGRALRKDIARILGELNSSRLK